MTDDRSTGSLTTVLAGCLAGAVLITSGCGPPVIDTSSSTALERSLAAVREPLSPAERDRFDESLGFLTGGASPADVVDDPDAEPLLLSLYRPVEGLGAEGVVTRARTRRTARVRQAVTALEQLRTESSGDLALLGRVRLSDARVFKRNRGFLQWPVIEVDVVNGTGRRLHLVRLRATLLAAGDPEPWMLEDLDHLVMHGLPPDARTTWRLEPEQQEWIQLIDPHPNVRFTLEVTGLLARGGSVIASTEWTALEAHRLALYRRTLEVLREGRSLALDLPPVARHHAEASPDSKPSAKISDGSE